MSYEKLYTYAQLQARYEEGFKIGYAAGISHILQKKHMTASLAKRITLAGFDLDSQPTRIIGELLGIECEGGPACIETRKICQALKKAGWQRKHKRVNGRLEYVWLMPIDTSADLPI